MIVTGANSGIGTETALEFARQKATVVLACRSLARTQHVLAEIRKLGAQAHFLELDLSDLGSVRRFADEFGKKFDRLDVLVNNGGVMALPQRQLTKDGFEMQYGTNHLGHFLLTLLLRDKLQAAALQDEARVVTVSALAHFNMPFGPPGHIHFDDINLDKTGYHSLLAYSQSKLANVLFARQLQKVADHHKLRIKSTSLHPGVINTELARYAFAH